MSFQDSAGTIIIDAVLTDIGRRRMAQGDFKITKFTLSDDEIDYSHGGFSGSVGDGYYYLFGDKDSAYINKTKFPTLEATTQKTSIISSLTDMPRKDIMYMPEFKVNSIIEQSVQKVSGVFYLSVNEETTKKLKSHLNINTQLLQNNEVYDNILVVESGIDNSTILATKQFRDRYIYNLKLFDQYVFVHCNTNFIDKVLFSNPDAHFKNDESDNMYENLSPLSHTHKTSLNGYLDEYDTYYCKTIQNNVFTHEVSSGGSVTIRESEKSAIAGPRSSAFAMNFELNPRLAAASNGSADKRYTLFGKTSQTLFGGSDTYDYIDTPIMIEGCATARRFQVTLRIIRYAG